MKKIFSYFFVAVLALMTISCSQGFEEQDIMPDVSENLVTMTITVEGDTYELKKGDSIHCGPNTEKEIKNNGIVTTQMLVILLPKKK